MLCEHTQKCEKQSFFLNSFFLWLKKKGKQGGEKKPVFWKRKIHQHSLTAQNNSSRDEKKRFTFPRNIRTIVYSSKEYKNNSSCFHRYKNNSLYFLGYKNNSSHFQGYKNNLKSHEQQRRTPSSQEEKTFAGKPQNYVWTWWCWFSSVF